MGVALAALLAIGLAGCSAAGGGGTSITATGRTLRIVLSVPPGGTSDPAARDVLDAEQLAFTQHSGDVHTYGLILRRLAGSKLSDNARTAIRDTTAIAYLGETAPGDSADSLGITNGQDLLQVSPTDTAQALTQKTPAVTGAPDRYYESLKSYGRTFARVVPTTAVEARAELAEAQRLGVKHLYVATDGSSYGSALAASLISGGTGVSVVRGAPSAAAFSNSNADGLLFAGASQTSARMLFTAVAAAHPAVSLMAPSALAQDSFAGSLGSARVIFSTPGFAPRTLDATGQAFVAAFTGTYHHAPAAEAIFGYEAMAAVIAALGQAGGSANNRATVVREFFGLRNRVSALGTYSIGSDGDTSLLDGFVFERLRAGRLVLVRG